MRKEHWKYAQGWGTPSLRRWPIRSEWKIMAAVMKNLSRREFVVSASAATLAATALPTLSAIALPAVSAPSSQRVFVASSAPDGILAFDWNSTTGVLNPAGVAAKIDHVAWITYSADHDYIFSASDVSSFNDKPSGEVASFRVQKGELQPLSAKPSAGTGTCHVALDRTGKVLLAADYTGGSAASFLVTAGQLSDAVWTEHYTGHGPNQDRQTTAHAHFCAFSPDNRFAYINDLGSDCIHIYHLDATTAKLTPAGNCYCKPGSGPRTLHFHPNGVTAYCINELDSTVTLLAWSDKDGSLDERDRIKLLPEDYEGPTRACDTVISKDGTSVYFANRDNDFIYTFKADPDTGALTPVVRSSCGGKTPRNFVLDPTERWMLVANQDSNQITVLARNHETGALATEGKSYPAVAPMRILFR
jgi:6-phosphogluconolactonase